MSRRFLVIGLALFGLVIMLSACGDKSQEQVTDQLTKQITTLEGYQADAEMMMNTGLDEQKYLINILYMAEDHYRIELRNAEAEEESQIILKNEDGVFVVTPGQQKSFKFQSEWPENSSQSYLYHSLVNDVLQDPESNFKVTDDYYVYYTKANYQGNNQLPSQEIFFNKKSLSPSLVNVLDNDQNTVVQVRFTQFELNPDISISEFQVEENIVESLAAVDDLETDSDFEVLYPLNTLGSELSDHKEVNIDDGKRVLMVFSGDKNFTLVQEKQAVEPTFGQLYEMKGELVNLGFTIGGISESSIEWSVSGVDYYLGSDELTKEELIEVAMSVQGREIK